MNDLLSSVPQVDLVLSQLRGNHCQSAPGQPVMGPGAWAIGKTLARVEQLISLLPYTDTQKRGSLLSRALSS